MTAARTAQQDLHSERDNELDVVHLAGRPKVARS